jgi:ABC-type Fe3+ transport system permease subunit
MLDFFRAGGFNMVPLTVLGIAMVVTAIKFARQADPQKLSLIRALTMAIAFCTIIGVAAGLASTAHYVVEHDEALKDPLPYLLQGFAETMTNAILGGSFAVLAWILVAVGVRRMPKEL